MHIQIVKLQPLAGEQRGEQAAVYTKPKITRANIDATIGSYAEVVAQLPETERVNVFYTMAVHTGSNDSDRPQRKASTFMYQEVFGFDIDGMDPSHLDKWAEYRACAAEVLNTDPENITTICSGAGFHLLVQLKYPIRQVEFFKKMRPHYNSLLMRLENKLREADLSGRPDPKIFDAARIMRLPGTTNRKAGRPDTECRLLHYSNVRLDLLKELETLSGLGDLETKNVSLQDVRKLYPRADFEAIVEECEFVKHCLEKPEDLHEPDAFDLFGLLSQMPPEAKAVVNGLPRTPRETAQYVFDNASGSRSLAKEAFDAKFDNAARYGIRRCDTIQERTGKCQSCKHFGQITCALAIKRPDFISSADAGYWQHTKKGKQPHYLDLIRVYSQERSTVCRPNGDVLTFLGTHWNNQTEIELKKWIQAKMSPPEGLQERHRMEFIKTLQADKAMTQTEESALFKDSINGKLNLKTGVLDIKTGELLPHSYQYGFMGVLPHAYTPGAYSEYFLDWLELVSCSRPEVMEAVLDMMAYCLWPEYSDHVFAILTGTGKNGKSTLLHIIEAIVGSQNIASVSLQQLTSSRFAGAELEGRMVNLSEESSGRELTHEQMNQLKNMSSGGNLYIERKGVQGYTARCTAKLIFSANTLPRFAEQDEALKRRLLVIPFDYTIGTPDSRVEAELIAAAPEIFSMLVDRIQDKIREEGVFRVSRGGETGAQEQEKAMMTGSSFAMFMDEMVEVQLHKPENFIPVAELYAAYLSWCAHGGFTKPINKISMGKMLKTYYTRSDTEIRKIGGKATRVVPRVSFKSSLEVDV